MIVTERCEIRKQFSTQLLGFFLLTQRTPHAIRITNYTAGADPYLDRSHACMGEEGGEIFYDCREPPEISHPISDTGDINPTVKTSPCRHMWRTIRTMRIPLTVHAE